MANTNINIRMDADLKRQFEAFCADMGMTMTTAFNVFARKAVREYRIPFEISGDVPNAETVEAIQEVKRMKADPSLGKTYSNVDQMMEELLADVAGKLKTVDPKNQMIKEAKRTIHPPVCFALPFRGNTYQCRTRNNISFSGIGRT